MSTTEEPVLLRAAPGEVRNQALEEAAKAVEQCYAGLGGPPDDPHPDAVLVNGTIHDCASRIRALKRAASTQPAEPVEKPIGFIMQKTFEELSHEGFIPEIPFSLWPKESEKARIPVYLAAQPSQMAALEQIARIDFPQPTDIESGKDDCGGTYYNTQVIALRGLGRLE